MRSTPHLETHQILQITDQGHWFFLNVEEYVLLLLYSIQRQFAS